MKPYAITVLVVAAAAFSLAFFEGVGWFARRPTRQNFWFVLFCVASGFYAAVCSAQYSVSTIAESVPFLRMESILVCIASWTLLQFLSAETGLVSWRFQVLFAVVFLASSVTQAVNLGTLTWRVSGASLTRIVLPWGADWSIPEAASGPVTDAEQVASAAFIFYLLWTSIRFLRRDPARGRAFFPVPIFITVAFVNDLLVGAGLLSNPYFLEFAFLAAVIYMGIEKGNRALETEKLLTRLAYFDPLTGLMNRAMFQNSLRAAIARAQRSGKRLALLFLDLDRFKYVNDTLGHAAGDAVLVQVAARFRARIRGSDTVARLGGDEFTVILEGIERSDDAAVLAKSLLNDLQLPVAIGKSDFYPGASIGIAIYPFDDTSAEGLTSKADTAMYGAKAEGGNNYRFVHWETHTKNLARIDLESQLRKAIDRGDFLLHYQPQIDLRTRQLTGVEALIRWKRHPDGEVFPPAHFLELAEETGLIVPIGDWVLTTACSTAARWKAQGRDLRMAVNFSPLQFRSADLPDLVEKALATSGLSAAGLVIELTESTLMRDDLVAGPSLKALKELGCRIALDDFGTGYSSFGYLTRFPVDELKVDQSFIRGVSGEPKMQSIVKALVVMAQGLGMETVAEGIETHDTARFLSDIGCDVGQGFLFGRPLDGESLLALPQSSTP